MDSAFTDIFQKLDLNNNENPPKPFKNKALKPLTKETPLEDFTSNMQAEWDYNYADDEDYRQNAFVTTFNQARDMIWLLLFAEPALSPENYKKAADLLVEYKSNVVFHCPWHYNEWIAEVRDELLRRKYFAFWQNVIVNKQLGLCCARDSDVFNDLDVVDAVEFYKVGEDFIKQQMN